MGHMYIAGSRVNISSNSTQFWKLSNPAGSGIEISVQSIRVYTDDDERIQFAEGADASGDEQPIIHLNRGSEKTSRCQMHSGEGEANGEVMPIEGRASAAAPFVVDFPFIIPEGKTFTMFVEATQGTTDTAVSIIWTEH